ncbi:MAG: MFS transporter [Desulforhopalus sp.]
MRYFVILSALVLQICLGATYSWSVYVHDIKALLGLSQAAAQVPFSVFYFVFPATMVVSGLILNKIGPRFSAMLGGALFASGWIIGSFGLSNFTYTILGNGVIAGIGAGIAYIVPISTCMKWFPHQKGLVTGIAVAGFGGGAALVSKIGGLLLGVGATPFGLFKLFGIAFFLLTVSAGFFMVNPEETTVQQAKPAPIKETITKNAFLILYFAMFSGLAAGFAINANIKELFSGANSSAGVTAVALFAIANAVGRITWGTFFDRFATKNVIQANLSAQAILLLAAEPILSSTTGLLIFSSLAGFNYGGVLVLYAGAVARIWGPQSVATTYGWLFSANIPGAVAPMLAAFCYDRTGSFTLALWIIAFLILVAIVLLQWKRTLFIKQE